MNELEFAISQIESTRRYTHRLIAELPDDIWFAMPGGPTHVAWQVGHIAVAEFRLACERMRGPRDDDEQILPTAFVPLFGRLSQPQPDPQVYPAPAEIRRVLAHVHQCAMAELAAMRADDLPLPPHGVHTEFDTRLGALMWCARHEMLHAGQLGMMRRLLAMAPLW